MLLIENIQTLSENNCSVGIYMQAGKNLSKFVPNLP